VLVLTVDQEAGKKTANRTTDNEQPAQWGFGGAAGVGAAGSASPDARCGNTTEDRGGEVWPSLDQLPLNKNLQCKNTILEGRQHVSIFMSS
jgi:hypothetical protein